MESLKQNSLEYEPVAAARDFHRIMVKSLLQIDFVNDRVYREGTSKKYNSYRIDNIVNILTDKMLAITSRDEEKDIFDLFTIAFNEKFNWDEMFRICEKKGTTQKIVSWSGSGNLLWNGWRRSCTSSR